MKLLATLLLVMGMLQNAAPDRGAIEGYVLEAGTNLPVSEAHVVLAGDGTTIRTTSDDRGYFAFDRLRPATYTLEVSRAGYYARREDGTNDIRVMRQVTLALDRAFDPVTISLIRFAEISGSVLDSYGQPLRNASVELLRLQTAISGRNSRQMLGVVKATGTSSTGYGGEYVFKDVEPGEYYLRVLESPTSTPSLFFSVFDDVIQVAGIGVLQQSGTITRVYSSDGATTVMQAVGKVALAYYPGVSSVSEASPIRVTDGVQLNADVRLPPPAPKYSISGSLTNSLTGASAEVMKSLFYFSVPADVAPDFWDIAAPLPISTSGEFQLSGLRAGTYHVFAGVGVIRTSAGMVLADALFPSGMATVRITDADVNGVAITLADTVPVTGRVVVQGAEFSPESISVVLQPVKFPPTMVRNLEVRVAADGSFAAATAPVLHDITVNGLPPRAYVSGIRQGGNPIANLRVNESANAPFEILINTDGGIVEGKVSGNPKAGTSVVLSGVRDGIAYRRETAVNLDGSYRLESVPPGDYRLFAVQRMVYGTTVLPLNLPATLLNDFERAAPSISIPAGGTVQADLTVMTVVTAP